MNIHSSARTSVRGRELLVQRVTLDDWSVGEAAEAAGVSPRTVYKWLGRFKSEGLAGLRDRSSRPLNSPTSVPSRWQEMVVLLRRSRMTAAQIARRLRLPRSTVARVLKRHGLERLKLLDPPEPARRYEKQRPGELLHLDVKKLGRFKGFGHRITGHHANHHRSYGAGWEFVHVCIDDYSRLAYVEILEDEKGPTTVGFLKRALAWFAEHGVKVQRVMTDNGTNYRSHVFRDALVRLRLEHSRTKPYTPRTNGKAERFIQTMLREWAYARPYQSSGRRRAALAPWLRRYNLRRPHGGIGGVAPITRLQEAA